MSVTVTPRNDKAGYNRVLGSWWRQFNPATRPNANNASDYPPVVVENDLAATLARRLLANALGKVEPCVAEYSRRVGGHQHDSLGPGARDAAGHAEPAAADLPLPEAVAAGSIKTPNLAADVSIEPIAMRVPVECFYMRAGSFFELSMVAAPSERLGRRPVNLISILRLDHGLNECFHGAKLR